ncbi:hypothetical protein [Kitasatospora sp. NPDC087315]|uniref:hypothetical protein n=1 Tax=Kitasatospora sp. NPDC087315 TaxID=3364069 RepID=UPI00381E6E14
MTNDELRTANLGLMPGTTFDNTLARTIDMAVAVETYYSQAASLGVPRERAAALLREAQGLAAGSTPAKEEISTARSLAIAEAMR